MKVLLNNLFSMIVCQMELDKIIFLFVLLHINFDLSIFVWHYFGQIFSTV